VLLVPPSYSLPEFPPLSATWALAHHLLAGIRYLLLDLDLGVDRAAARRSAWIVFALSVPLAAWFALVIFGVL